MVSLKGNIILSYLNTITGIVFPLITFPYATRVLFSEGIGTIDFLNSIINYIVLLTGLGIPFYGVREIAKCRNDIQQCQQKTLELAILNLSLCALGYVVVYILGTFISRIHTNLSLFYILSLSILFTAIGVQWFYQGIEDFKFITIRGIIVRVACATCLFFFVKEKDDLILYAFIVVGATVGNNIINFVHLRKYISLSEIRWKQLNIKSHIVPTMRVFMMSTFISVYIYLNSIFLGFIDNAATVGHYTAGIRVTHIICMVITSLGTVMLSRSAHLIETNDYERFNVLITKSYRFIMAISLPLTVGLIILATPITLLLCGSDFIPSIAVVRITAPTITIVSLADVIGMQILFPMNREKIVIQGTIVAAILSMSTNFLLIPYFSASGAAIATLLSEVSVVATEIILGRKFVPFKFLDYNIKKYLLGSGLMGIALTPTFLIENYWLKLVYGILVGTLVYFIFLYTQKEEITLEIIKTINPKQWMRK